MLGVEQDKHIQRAAGVKNVILEEEQWQWETHVEQQELVLCDELQELQELQEGDALGELAGGNIWRGAT